MQQAAFAASADTGALVRAKDTSIVGQADGDAFVDHWWVQIHDGDAWSNLDLSPPTAAPGEALAAAATETLLPAELDDDRCHLIAIRVIGEIWHGGARRTR